MEDSQLVRELSQPLQSAKGWLTFLGIVSILYGIFTALSIVGILIAWLPIWLGVLLLQAGSALDAARTSGDPAAMIRAMGKLKTYFIIWGVITLISLLLSLPMMMFAFSVGTIGGMGNLGSLGGLSGPAI